MASVYNFSLCLAMTINKSQGQTFKGIGVYLTDAKASYMECFM